MEVSKIVAELDKEIARLKEARALLAGISSPNRGSNNKKSATKSRKRTMTAEGRRRIAEAMKKRWAERRKQQSGKK
ncbi:hypothetical protein H7849_13585 [Alloacidobacterium dinghuense]|uniref:Uncharacterized protein n=1 Tax=Alloacidobacterium dinghuense TaxID=2763107 RepID=A0A7G8BCF1_9BACT|nr:hypothetical protein [Alloacidobacterium dinghuense]QNI30221.1 hypothetical protein H7849_13585 [Alloacidobacterium dinghuense]